MGRPKNWPPLPHPHKPSGQVRLRYDGVDYYLGPIDSEAARRKYVEVLASLLSPAEQKEKKQRKRGLTVREVADRWLEHAEARYEPEGKEARAHRASMRPLVAACPDVMAAEFGVTHLHQVREEMIRRDWCRGVIAARVARIRTAWRWAELNGLIPEGRWAALRALPPLSPTDRRVRTAPRRKATDEKTLQAVCAKVNDVARRLLLLCWYSGCRPGEARRLKVGEVDCTGEVWVARPAKHKCAWRGQSREVMLGPGAQAEVAQLLKDRPPDAYVFESRPGRCYHRDSLCRVIRKGAKKAGVSFTAYQIRHAFKRRVKAGMGLDAARAAMGHTKADQTEEYDAERDLDLAREAARRLG